MLSLFNFIIFLHIRVHYHTCNHECTVDIPVAGQCKINKQAFDPNKPRGSRVISKASSIQKVRFACQWLDNVDIHTCAYAKFDQHTMRFKSYGHFTNRLQTDPQSGYRTHLRVVHLICTDMFS